MKAHRRLVLKGIFALGAIAALPRLLLAARPDSVFQETDADKVIADLFGQAPTDSDQVMMKIPDIAENGAVVPVTIKTDLENVESISIVVVNNPTPLAASFIMSPRSVPTVSVRIKMGESSQVVALVKAGGAVYSTTKEVKVTIGGCGG
ncbi:MAG: thiosulfate oxidation carrier protein SoxY [Gammaproteobacteria bacterium]|jgi:sulfur-oxidizing protein SoxY|nr:MAG: thiosulfate oxidation carrier protein SoxY [Gammaproteobacteria bacterium]RLA28066.1 MAG: thiosulfate oxidation carrier protein SoxY [Gammaproteobacteria bacterium]